MRTGAPAGRREPSWRGRFVRSRDAPFESATGIRLTSSPSCGVAPPLVVNARKTVPYSPVASSLVRTPSPSVSFFFRVGHPKWPPCADPWMCWAWGWSGTRPWEWMTTFRPPLSSAVRVAVPLTPLPFCSTSFAFTVVSAAALVGRHSRAAAAASMSELRNLIMYSLPQIGSTRRARSRCRVPPFDPRYRQPMSSDTEAPLDLLSAAPFIYHADFCNRIVPRNRTSHFSATSC